MTLRDRPVCRAPVYRGAWPTGFEHPVGGRARREESNQTLQEAAWQLFVQEETRAGTRVAEGRPAHGNAEQEAGSYLRGCVDWLPSTPRHQPCLSGTPRSSTITVQPSPGSKPRVPWPTVYQPESEAFVDRPVIVHFHYPNYLHHRDVLWSSVPRWTFTMPHSDSLCSPYRALTAVFIG